MLPEYKDDSAFRPDVVSIRNLKREGFTVFIAENDSEQDIPRVAKKIAMNKDKLVRPISILATSGHGDGYSVHLTDEGNMWDRYKNKDDDFLDVNDLPVIEETSILRPTRSDLGVESL